ncbi:MAG: peptidoglycan editing factor PgeF [Nitrospinaceae bacterium]|nr:peptidoglycan editing factor PgeF [Nitrospinaceae bacterium]NIS86867.1 peptidoglycan editing factor PgeF [Nitrospinaceae bacterium]NIT83703.1 peptidoglycan editing factor PgeF [Nitrospinaceae bacterium]NIU45899.1 peptidoglycan editing factor PgeF [Nitrospinaceae bacterium]NIU98059.1 peptidoglycan editing factor PgeF [Nitrospinaceae bacterium]
MDVRVDSLVLEGLRHAGWVHGFSPRTFQNARGEREELSFRREGHEAEGKNHRRWFLQSLGIASEAVALVEQVHGDRVHVLKTSGEPPARTAQIQADAILTHLPERPIGVLTADCVPIVLYDPRNHVAGVIHAGRKGTARRIFSKTVNALKTVYGSRPETILAGLGPGIGGCCYEVAEECLPSFREEYPEWSGFVQPSRPGHCRLDLFQANVEDGLSAGISRDHLVQAGECTACRPHRWFSYRREGPTGRMLSVAMLRRL